jgi:vitamin B12 transporter
VGRPVEDRESQETCQSFVPQDPSREGGSRVSSLIRVKPQSLMKVGAFFIHHHSKEKCAMHYPWNAALCSTFLFVASALAADKDSTKTYHEKDVVVIATRSEISPSDAPSPVQIISSSSIQQLHATTIADLLHLTNGVNIKYYGSTGGVKNLTFRGLSTENSLILVNGNPINDPQNGSVDLSLFSVNTIERMEIFNGGASALYGGDALGGVVNIITRRASNDLHMCVQGDVGSFGAVRTLAEVQGRFAGVGLLAGVSREYGNDNYKFIFHRQTLNDTTLIRKNADYHRTQVYWNSDYQISDLVDINTTLQYIWFQRGAPGPVYSPFSVSVARQSDETLRATFGSHVKLYDHLLITFDGAFNRNSEVYRDSLEPSDAFYHSKNYTLNGQIEWSPLTWDRIIAGGEFGEGYLDASGISWGSPLTMHPVRVQKSLYLSNESVYQTEREWFDRISFYQSIRYDNYSDIYEDAVSPKLGMNIRIYQKYEVHIRSSWGKNFRVPTFNDKYYPVFGNPRLNPERSTAFDIGIIASLEQSGRQILQVTYFDIDSEKKIAFNNMFPYNIGEAENSGLEIRYDYHSLDNTIDAFFGLSIINAVKKGKSGTLDPSYNKQLPYVPKSLGILGFSIETEIGKIVVNQSVMGSSFITPDEGKSLLAYTLTDIKYQKKLKLAHPGLILQCSVSNLFDVEYQSFEGYPMPGRSYNLGLGIEY